jgi:hypothetical protein
MNVIRFNEDVTCIAIYDDKYEVWSLWYSAEEYSEGAERDVMCASFASAMRRAGAFYSEHQGW